MFNTLREKSIFYLKSMLGARLGWLNINVPNFLIFMFIILLMLSILKVKNEKLYFNKKDRCLIVIIICLVFSLVCAAMLLSWTPLSYNTIEGVQGRYFLPILPLALLLFRNSTIALKKSIDNILIFSIWILQILTIASVLQWII
jgi:uncharacterized membrane protein